MIIKKFLIYKYNKRMFMKCKGNYLCLVVVRLEIIALLTIIRCQLLD